MFAGQEWWVIGLNGSGVYSQPGDNAVTLLLKSSGNPYGITMFGGGSNYSSSLLQGAMSTIASGFPAGESAIINARATLDGIEGASPADQKLWPLSIGEWNTINDNTIRSFGEIFWLRSPESPGNVYVGRPTGDGFNLLFVYHDVAIRPAFQLNLSSVLFTSAASRASGKSAVTVGSGLASATATTGAVKLTVRDDVNLSLTCTDTNPASQPVSIPMIVNNTLSSSKDITAFSINGVNGTITEGSPNTIAVTLPYGTNVTNLSPSITHTGVNVSPASGVPQDFLSSMTYTVTAQDGSTKDYIVTVYVEPPPVNASASVLSVTVSGTAGSALGGGQRATITLTGDTMAGNLVNVDASGWFTGLPGGVTVTANASAGGSAITLTFGGTPTAASTAQFNITIPGSVLTGGSPIAMAANQAARFNITEAAQPPSDIPQTGDGFPLYALLGVCLSALGWLGLRMRSGKPGA